MLAVDYLAPMHTVGFFEGRLAAVFSHHRIALFPKSLPIPLELLRTSRWKPTEICSLAGSKSLPLLGTKFYCLDHCQIRT